MDTSLKTVSKYTPGQGRKLLLDAIIQGRIGSRSSSIHNVDISELVVLLTQLERDKLSLLHKNELLQIQLAQLTSRPLA